MADIDLIVIGAGPAGMSAATTASHAGLSVVLLDEQPAAGGQIYRGIESADEARGEVLGSDYLNGLNSTDALNNAVSKSNLRHIFDATVWQINKNGEVAYSIDGNGHLIKAKRIIIATGALERATPIPGWSLPGVMTAGAGQILLKQSGLAARRAVIAGSGPLIYLLAQQMIRAGSPPLALIETQTKNDLFGAMRYLPGALRGWRTLAKGVAMLGEIRKSGVPRIKGASGLGVEGNKQAEALTFTRSGRSDRIECDMVLLHQGVVPNTQATRSLDLKHTWDKRQRCFRPIVSRWGQSELETIYVAGDGAGIGGAIVAEHAGKLAALHIAAVLGHLDQSKRDELARPIRRALAEGLAVRPFLEAAYPPSPEILRPDDKTIICRCEEVTAGDIRRFAKLGCTGPNQTKAFGRCGMGPCQGRYCGLTVTEILAEANGTHPEWIGSYRIRPPLKPVTLGELANLELNGRKQNRKTSA